MTDTIEQLDDDNAELIQPSELDVLKLRADDMGIKYSPNIGVAKLREKVNTKLAGSKAPEPVASKAVPKYQELRNEATKLVRVRITNLNPNKKHSEGEYFRTGNSVISTITRFVPFEHETHVENMLLTMIKNREYAIVTEKKGADGKLAPVRGMRREFQVEVLPPLTTKELDKLASDQSKRQSV